MIGNLPFERKTKGRRKESERRATSHAAMTTEDERNAQAQELRRRRPRSRNTYSFGDEDFYGHVPPYVNSLEGGWRPNRRPTERDGRGKRDGRAMAPRNVPLWQDKDSPKWKDTERRDSNASRTPRMSAAGRGPPMVAKVARKEDYVPDDDEDDSSEGRGIKYINKYAVFSLVMVSLSVALGSVAIVMYSTRIAIRVNQTELPAILLFIGASLGGYWWVVPLLVVEEMVLQSSAVFSPKSLIVYFSIVLQEHIRHLLYGGLVLGLWAGLFRNVSFYRTFLRILGCAMTVLGARAINRFFIKLFSMNYHQRTYFQKVYKALQNEFLLVVLQTGTEGMDTLLRKESLLKFSPMTFLETTKLTVKKPWSLAEMYHLKESELYSSPYYLLRTAKHIRKCKIPVIRQGTNMNPDLVDELESSEEATKLAKRLFRKLRSYKQAKSVTLNDLLRVMSEDDARIVLDWDQKSEFEEITYTALCQAVVSIYEERKSLSLTLADSHTVLNKVAIFTGCLLGIIVVVVWLLIFEINVLELWIAVGSSILGLSFIFGSSIQMIFETSMFIFFVHPFDVKDDIEVDGEQYIVESIGLHTTMLTSVFGRSTFVRTNDLAKSRLVNLSRSKFRVEVFHVVIDISIQGWVCKSLADRLLQVFESDKDEFGVFSISWSGLHPPMKIELKVVVEYLHGGEDLARLNWDRSRVLAAIKEVMCTYNVDYTMGIQPISGLEVLREGFNHGTPLPQFSATSGD